MITIELHGKITNLANKGEDQIVDANIALQSRGEAGEEDRMVHEERGCFWVVETLPQHVQLVVCKVAARCC